MPLNQKKMEEAEATIKNMHYGNLLINAAQLGIMKAWDSDTLSREGFRDILRSCVVICKVGSACLTIDSASKMATETKTPIELCLFAHSQIAAKHGQEAAMRLQTLIEGLVLSATEKAEWAEYEKDFKKKHGTG